MKKIDVISTVPSSTVTNKHSYVKKALQMKQMISLKVFLLNSKIKKNILKHVIHFFVCLSVSVCLLRKRERVEWGRESREREKESETDRHREREYKYIHISGRTRSNFNCGVQIHFPLIRKV